ncbi:MAG: hypothetical protein ABWZ25_15165 [Chitinophagaceae bacterium]
MEKNITTDLHHIPNKKDIKGIIKDFDTGDGIAVTIPSYEHIRIRHFDYSRVQNLRSLLFEELRVLRKYTKTPPAVLIKIIEANKGRYPEYFKKKKNGFK